MNDKELCSFCGSGLGGYGAHINGDKVCQKCFMYSFSSSVANVAALIRIGKMVRDGKRVKSKDYYDAFNSEFEKKKHEDDINVFKQIAEEQIQRHTLSHHAERKEKKRNWFW